MIPPQGREIPGLNSTIVEMKRERKKIEKIRKKLEEEGIRVENDTNTTLLLHVMSEIRSLSRSILGVGLAIIGTIITFGVALLSLLSYLI